MKRFPVPEMSGWRVADGPAKASASVMMSLAGIAWPVVVQEQAARLVSMEREIAMFEDADARRAREMKELTYQLADARKTAEDACVRVVQLEAMKSKANKRTRGLRQKFNQAVRVITGQGRVEKRLRRAQTKAEKASAEWRDVAVAEQEALRVLTLERDALKEALRTTTADMNRYFADWKQAVGQVQDLQGQLDIAVAQRDELEHEHSIAYELRDILGLTVGVRLQDGLRQVMAELAASQARVAELEAELVAVKRAAAKAAGVVSLEHAEAQNVLRANFHQEIQGLRVILADKEREAWHGALMVKALRFDLPVEEVARISEECWGLMKSGVDGRVLTAGGAIVAVPVGEVSTTDDTDSTDGEAEGATTESTESTEEAVAIMPDESPTPKCASCGDELSLSERHCVTPKGSRYCEPCYDVHMEALAAEGGAV